MYVYVYIDKLIKSFWFYRGRFYSHMCITQSNVYMLKGSGMFLVTSSLSSISIGIICTRNLTILGSITFPKYYWKCRGSFCQLSFCYYSEQQGLVKKAACLRGGVI